MCNTCGCKSAETFEAKEPTQRGGYGSRGHRNYDCEKGRHRWRDTMNGRRYYPTQDEDGLHIIIEENQQGCQDCGIYKTYRNTYDFKEASFEKPKSYHMTYGSKKGKVVPIYDEKMERFLEESNAPTYHRTFLDEVLRGYGAEEGKVRTMSGKPHTPRKLSKDQNIKPEEARMRKKMEAQSKGKSKCSKHYWDLAVRRNPISGERQFFNQCLLCGKKNFSRGGSAMSDRGFFAEGGSKCEGKKLKDSGYCDLDFDYSSSGLYAKCSDCGNEEFQDEYWDSHRISYTEPDEGQVLCAVKEGGSEDDLGYCSFDWGWGSGNAYASCDVCGTEVDATFDNQFYDDEDDDEDFEAQSYQVREGFDTCETCGDSPLFVSTQIAGGTYCMDCANRVWRAESPFSSDAFNEGRSAGITMFIPEGDAEDYYSNLDTEYMIFYGLSPEDLAKDIDGNSKRYLQFVAGWDDGWNYATLLHEGVLADDSDSEGDLEDLDYEMAGEWIYQDFPEGLREYVPSAKELGAEVAVLGGIVALGLGYFIFKDKVGFKGETFRATESCSEDEDCPDGKVCVDGKCLPICVDDGDCASWRECRDDLHPTEKVCGEDKTDSTENPFSDFVKREENQVDEPTEPNATEGDTYSTTTKALIGVGIVGAIGVGIKVLGGMQDKGDE